MVYVRAEVSAAKGSPVAELKMMDPWGIQCSEVRVATGPFPPNKRRSTCNGPLLCAGVTVATGLLLVDLQATNLQWGPVCAELCAATGLLLAELPTTYFSYSVSVSLCLNLSLSLSLFLSVLLFPLKQEVAPTIMWYFCTFEGP